MARATDSADHGEGSVLFTHLFSAPLIELIEDSRNSSNSSSNGGGGAGTRARTVPELSYEGERDSLLRTLSGSARNGKGVRFLSEAANTKSFARAVGCPSAGAANARVAPFAGVHGLRGGPACASGSGPGAEGSGSGSCRDGDCRIIHFTGHGEPGQLTFEDEHGQLQYVDADFLLAMLQCRQPGDAGPTWAHPGRGRSAVGASREAGTPCAASEADFGAGVGHAPLGDVSMPSSGVGFGGGKAGAGADERGVFCRNGLQLVFLSACYSQSVAESFIKAGVRHVIAVKENCKVLDHKAAEFTESFYTSLFRGDKVRVAFLLGLHRLGLSDNAAESHKFLLLPPDGNHDIPLFEEALEGTGEFINDTPEKPLYRCDAVAEHFWGRAVDVQKVVKHLVDGDRCVTITGQKGIGKTQVLVKACAYTRERHVFGDIFFCRVDKVERGNDACNWLEKGFQLPAGSLGAHDMDGAVAKITAHVKRELRKLKQKGSLASARVLLVLDGCDRHVVVGEQRVKLKDLLSRLFNALPNLTAAVTMRATGPTKLGRVGVPGEEVIVVEGLDDRSTAELFHRCCPRKLLKVEMDPENEARKDGNPDALAVFAKGDIVRALKGHPACAQALCRRVTEERSLFLYRKRLLEKDIPELQKQYAYGETERSYPRISPTRNLAPVLVDSAKDALDSVWSRVSGTYFRYFSGDDDNAGLAWGRICKGIAWYFEARVPGARGRPLENADFDLFAEEPTLWEGDSPAAMALKTGMEVAAVLISREKIVPFWLWFWEAISVLRRTGAWMVGESAGHRCFAGFMTRRATEISLSTARPGTFLIRFSTTKRGAFAVHYASLKGRGVVNVVVQVREGGRLSCEIGKGKRGDFRNLDDLALSMKMLVYLYPGTPKERAFHLPHHRNSLPLSIDVPDRRENGVRRRQSLPLS